MIGNWTQTDDAQLHQLFKEINTFSEWIFQHHEYKRPRGAKVIHDGVWGTSRYNDFEISLINSPLMQRLRNIHQTAYTFFTYPSSHHTRFDHSLGVTSQVGKLYSALKNKFQYSKDEKDQLPDDFQTLRTAALLHDCGHGPFSHTSEEIYKFYPEIEALLRNIPFKSASPHEAMSSLIILSKSFQEFLNKVCIACNKQIDRKLMVEAIVGYVSDPNSRYKVDFLNGPFDADKLDYLFRDGHFSGLPLNIDLDRLWYAIDINMAEENRRLTVDWGGTSSLEQIMFAKMTLYPAVYHHHKVRACDCMYKGIIEYIKSLSIPFNDFIKSDDKSSLFERAIHFLYFDDNKVFEILARRSEDIKLHKLIHNLFYRRLLKRCVVISADTIEEIESLDHILKYREEFEEKYREIADDILEEAGRVAENEEIGVDCPSDPNFNSAFDTWISPLKNGDCEFNLTKFFSITQWADQYKHRKWRGHVFCPADKVDVFTKATKKVFEEKLKIRFKPIAFELCHIQPPN
ncbi:MAG: HD domain-containing protein [Proteobacteria bacterium]|nr:HD domain-containing protein [Pseudomonadota bacterium]